MCVSIYTFLERLMNNNKKIKLISFYVDSKCDNRKMFLASNNKLKYIISTLNSLDYIVESYSASRSDDGKFVFNTDVYGNKYYYLKSHCSKTKLINKILTLIFKLKYMFFVFKNVKKGDCVFVYHSLFYMKLVKFLKIFKNIKLIYEIEEIYSDVVKNVRKKKKELLIFTYADAYLFPSYLFLDLLSINRKPYVVIHGSYEIPQIKERIKFNDDKVHIVYAGTFNSVKGGVFNAIDCAKYLNEKFVIHILGRGTNEENEIVISKINQLNSTCYCKIVYEGQLLGEEFFKFLSKCSIGLSTQKSDGDFNNSSFPSKILTYLSCGLRVISNDIEAVRTSDIGEKVFYYNDLQNSSMSIANQIIKVSKENEASPSNVVLELSNTFYFNIKKLLENL